MSKIGKLPITIPDSVTVNLENNVIEIQGKLGKLSQTILNGIKVSHQDNELIVTRKNDKPQSKANHGLMRSLIQNMVIGVSEGWKKNLELIGTGYRAQLQGNNISLAIGYSHPVVINAPEQIKFTLDGQTKITVEGIDKQLVGQIAAKIRTVRPPEPYKGKGIRYQGEKIRRKAGKAASGAGAA